MVMDDVNQHASRRGKPPGRHPDKRLSPAFVRNAQPGRHCDGQGLYLLVQPSGTRSWIQRLVIRGRRRELGLGSIPLVSLAEAREKAIANRKVAREGGDPLADKRRVQRTLTFEAAAAKVLEQKRAGWRSTKHGQQWWATLKAYAFPRLGTLHVSEITSADVLGTLQPIWHTRGDTALRVRQRIHAVLEWAIAMQYRTDNPCDRLGPVLGKQKRVVRHMRALPHAHVAVALAAIRATSARPVVKLAFEFMVLTAARPGEARGARWSEVDLDAAVWTIPAERMKALREHRVPLSGRAAQVLGAARMLGTGDCPLVFPTAQGKPLTDMALSRSLTQAGIPAVPHGFRSTFRDWAAEETNHPREVVEAALAHTVRDQVEAAYARSDLFERRRTLMNDWEAYLGITHPHRRTVEPAAHEFTGTIAPQLR